MAITIPSLKEPAAWLEIGLSCQQFEHKVELAIAFTNTQAADQEFAFSNQARKAELLGLLVTNEAGERVMPTHNVIVRPITAALENHTLKPQATFSYLLVGTLQEYKLVFPGAIFTLNSGETYQLRFRYAGKQSNGIFLTVPPAEKRG